MKNTRLTPTEKTRYGRHLTLTEVGEVGQEKLKATSVLVIGVGGLGAPLSMYLAAAGIGRLTLVDFDKVDESNLQRQVLYRSSDVGGGKAELAAARLRELNPFIQIDIRNERFSLHNAAELVADHDIVADGADNFATRYLVNDACVLGRKPLVSASLLGFEGQLSVYNHAGGPCYRCLYSEPPPPGTVPSCAEGGVLGALCGVMGSLQAVEVIKLALGHQGLAGRLLHFDAWGTIVQNFQIRRDPECPICGAHPKIKSLQETIAQCGLPAPEIEEITCTELARKLGSNIVLLDVREESEVKAGQLPGAQWIPLGQIEARLAEIPRDREVVAYCRSGARSRRAAEVLVKQGVQVANLKGGVVAWKQEIDPGFIVG